MPWLLAAAAALSGAAWGQAALPQAPIGGRPAALGHAYSALATDAYAPVWNPAALALTPVPQAALMHAGGSGAASRQTATIALPLSSSLGGGLAADMADGQSLYGLALGARAGAGALGAAARYLDGDGTAARPHAWAADLAGAYRLDRRLTAAFVAANLGGRAPSLQQPGFRRPEARLGAGYLASRRITYALEAVYSRSGGAGVRSGLELRLLDWLQARLGIDSTEQGTSGVGLTTGIGLAWAGQSLDVAYLPRGRDSLEQLSLVVRFGRPPEVALDDPAGSATKPIRASSRPLSFHLEPASAAVPDPVPLQPASKPKPAPSRDRVDVQQPAPPPMIWLPQ